MKRFLSLLFKVFSGVLTFLVIAMTGDSVSAFANLKVGNLGLSVPTLQQVSDSGGTTDDVLSVGGLLPFTTNSASIGSTSNMFTNLYVTGTVVLGGALQVSNVTGGDSVQIGFEQFPGGAAFKSSAPLNIYASTTGYTDTFTMTAAANGADGACFSAKNLGGTLGRQCQVSGTPSYYIMASTGLAFQDDSTSPLGTPVDMVIRSNRVGIANAAAVPNTTLEVVGQTSSTNFYSGVGTAAAPGFTFGNDTDIGLYRLAANTPAMAAAGAHSLNFNDGWVSVGGVDFASTAEGDGYYFGDNVRGLRYLTSGDFEFQNWHLNKFYFTKYNGSTRIRYAVFDSVYKRLGLSDNTDLVNTAPTTSLEVAGTGVSSTLLYVGSGVNQYSISNVQAAIVNTGTTSTLQLGNTNKPGCFKMTDVAGVVQYVTLTAAGAFQISTTACNP